MADIRKRFKTPYGDKMNKGTKEGTEEEIAFVKELNSNKQSRFWKILIGERDSKNYFAVHVTQHKLSKIIGRKVKPKADIYLVHGNVPIEYLREKDFYLTEQDVSMFSLKKINFSGISTKRRDSARYQILKMNPKTFKKIFGCYELGAGASIYCSKISDLEKNDEVLKGWNTNWEKFERYFSFINNIGVLRNRGSNPRLRLNVAKAIKTYSNKKITSLIKNDKKISDFVFKGIGNFEEPYTASWLFEKGILKKATQIPFVITTGSGRSHGDFTIVVKPR